jgi:hypothetical protein
MDIEHYNNNREKLSPLVEHNGAAYGFWLIGRWHNTTKGGTYYYGAYPPSYLKRLQLLFPDEFKGTILHLFSGTVEGDGDRVFTLDCNPEPIPGVKPDFVIDAERLNECIPEKYFDIIIADPPYGNNHTKYGVKKRASRKKVIHLCSKILKPGGYLAWLDTLVVQWAKRDGWKLRGLVGLCQSTNHQVRVITILQKVKTEKEQYLFK